MIRPVDKKSVSDDVYNQVLDLIITGSWAPGDKIPSENELKNLFRVSRNTVRGAINKLKVLGLAETISGEGTFIKSLDSSFYMNYFIPSAFLQKKDFLEIMEFRKGIEIEAARLAALRANEEDIDRIEELLNKMEECNDNIKQYSKYDIEYHVSIAYASGNSMYKKIMDIIQHLLMSKLQDFMIKNGNTNSLFYHQKIMQAIKKRDPELAGHFMDDHLSSVIKRMVNN